MKQTYEKGTGEITVTMAIGEIAQMLTNEQKLWITPGASRGYIASHKSFREDKVLVGHEDFEEASGYAIGQEDAEANEEISVTVKLR